jgi:hypothetical protein
MRATGDNGAWLVAGLVVVVVLVAVGAAATPAAADPAEEGYGAPTTWYVAVGADGDARFAITMRFALSTANETRGFRRLANEFENGTTTVLPIETFERAANRSAASTGRAMEITDVDRSSRIENDTGALVLSFTWTSFARTPEDRIVFGDVFRTPSGTWLPGLTEDQELIIAVPPRYDPTSLSWPLRNGSVYVRGPAAFDPGQPAATFELSGPVTPTVTTADTPTPTRTATPTPTLTPTDGTTPTEGNGTVTPQESPMGPILGGVAVLALIAALAYLTRGRDGTVPGVGTAEGGDGGDGAAPGARTDGPDADPGAEPAEESPEEASAGEEEPLLSDEERVLELLDENEGRMKQAAIVRETDWSNAKVSQLLSEMADDGEIEKLRIGRENLITLPEETPESVD